MSKVALKLGKKFPNFAIIHKKAFMCNLLEFFKDFNHLKMALEKRKKNTSLVYEGTPPYNNMHFCDKK